MKPANDIFFDTQKCKHRSLTAILRRDGFLSDYRLGAVLATCNVSSEFGQLPPELRARVPAGQMQYVIREFRKALHDYLLENKELFLAQRANVLASLPQIGRLFGTDCILEYKNDVTVEDVDGLSCVEDWSGSYGVVVKLSFPQIGAAYAVKIFRGYSGKNTRCGHGPMFEIPTAFCASYCQSRDYMPVYMASLSLKCPYMLSKWGGDLPDYQVMQPKSNMIYSMDLIEVKPWNLRGGKCIDFGKTYKTLYGKLTYRGRKMYRQLSNAAARRDTNALDKIVAATHGTVARDELRAAMRVVDYMQYVYSNPVLRKIRHEYLCR